MPDDTPAATERDREKAQETAILVIGACHGSSLGFDEGTRLIAAALAAAREEERRRCAALVRQVAAADDESELGARAAEAFNHGNARSMAHRLRDWSEVIAKGIEALTPEPDHD
jgi:hypothetical protein